MKKLLVLALLALASCSADDATNETIEPIDPIEQIRFVETNDTLSVSNKYWLEVRQNQMYNVFSNGQGRTLEVTSNNVNSTFFTSDNRYRIYSITSQKRVVKKRLKYVNNVLVETIQTGNQFVMTATAFNNNRILKFDTITRTYTDENGVDWIAN